MLITEANSTDLVLFKQWQSDLQKDTAEYRKIVLLEVEARLRRLSLENSQPGETTENTISPSTLKLNEKVEEMARFIAEHYREPLRVAQIAASANLSPNYAMYLFRKTLGFNMIDYLTQHRLAHAQRLLTLTETKIVDIAFEAGFGSVSRFYEVFQQVYKQSPHAYRQSLLF